MTLAVGWNDIAKDLIAGSVGYVVKMKDGSTRWMITQQCVCLCSLLFIALLFRRPT